VAEREENAARLKANLAALARIDQIASSDHHPEEITGRLRTEYQDRINQLESVEGERPKSAHGLFSAQYDRISREALQIERNTILQLRNEKVINDEVLRRIQRDIDLAEARLGGRD
jgi:monovalent cation/hydrogen antiporter